MYRSPCLLLMRSGIARVVTLATILLSLGIIGVTQTGPNLPSQDRLRLSEAFRLADSVGDRLWPMWNRAPFAVLLVTQDKEFLIRHPRPSPEFQFATYDRLLKTRVYIRGRTFDLGFLATFPAVSGIPTIVVGQAEATTAKSSTPWVVTILHEHFHQLQTSQPTYYAEIERLGLARGDNTGMWMLNYAFPYDDDRVDKQFSMLCSQLAELLEVPKREDVSGRLTAYLKLRRSLRELLKPDDYRYLSFQLWQEGIARYTEYHAALRASQSYEPGQGFRSLADFTPYADVATAMRERIVRELTAMDLAKNRRTAFYAMGAAEGLLLDRVNPGWRGRYFEVKFDLAPLLQPGAR